MNPHYARAYPTKKEPMSTKLETRVEDAVRKALVALDIEGWTPHVYHDKDRFGGVTVRLDKIEVACTGVSLPEANTFSPEKLQRYFELQITNAMKNKLNVDWLTLCPGPEILDVSRKMREFDEAKIDVELGVGK